MESLLLEKLGDNTINDYGDHQRSWLFATASMDSLGVIYWVDLCVCAYIGKKGEKENGHLNSILGKWEKCQLGKYIDM